MARSRGTVSSTTLQKVVGLSVELRIEVSDLQCIFLMMSRVKVTVLHSDWIYINSTTSSGVKGR